MNVTATPTARSSVLLEIELPPERLQRALDVAIRHLSRRTRVPGFRPGKAPRQVIERVVGAAAVMDEAVEHLVSDAYRDALVEKEILPLANAQIEVVQAEEGKPFIFKATVPVRPTVTLGDYRSFNFRPEIEEIDDARVEKVVEELRDQNATLAAVEDRPAEAGDYAVIAFTGTRDGEPFEGGSSERMPLVLGEDRLIPGFEDHVIGLSVGDETEFAITFPQDYPEEGLAGKEAHFSVTLKELREKVQPDADDDFAQSLGPYPDLATLKTEIRQRLERNAVDRARHEFSDRIIDYAVANATLELPDILVDQEVEVMHDEFRVSLGRQGIEEAAYLKAVDKTEADLHADLRPSAEKRVKALLVLSKIAEEEGIELSEAEVEAEAARARERYASDRKLAAYFDSERGRNFIKSTLRRSRTVEKLVDDWLAAHPDHPPLPHAEDAEAGRLPSDTDGTDTEPADAAETGASGEHPASEPTTPAEAAAATEARPA